MGGIHPESYAFVFADIEGPSDLSFDTVRQLRSGGHKSVDFYVLYPSSMIARLVSYNDPQQYAGRLNSFFGTDEWQAVFRAMPSVGQSRQRTRKLIELYMKQLGTLWTHVINYRYVRMTGNNNHYVMLFASDNAAADRIAKGVVKVRQRDEPDLFSQR